MRIQTLLGWLGIAVFLLHAILTSAGQSIDLYVVQTLLKKGEVECEIKELLTAEELKNYKTLVLALGGSAKGLAAAGVTLEEELERIRSLIGEAEKQGQISTLPDLKREGHEDIYRLYEAGILIGRNSAGTFDPYEEITRAEAAAMLEES